MKRGKHLWRNERRRLIASVTLLAYVFAAIGFPLPATTAQPSAGAHPCGQAVCCCGSEAACRASGCGCEQSPLPFSEEVTSEEKPAEYGEAPESDTAVTSCCSKSGANASALPASVKPHQAAKASPKKPSGIAVKWVIGLSAQKCRGGATEWVSAQAALPGQEPVRWSPSWPFCHWVSLNYKHLFAVPLDLTDPPPRFQAV